MEKEDVKSYLGACVTARYAFKTRVRAHMIYQRVRARLHQEMHRFVFLARASCMQLISTSSLILESIDEGIGVHLDVKDIFFCTLDRKKKTLEAYRHIFWTYQSFSIVYSYICIRMDMETDYVV